jgi:uncharacterized protein (TIGR03083 family)
MLDAATATAVTLRELDGFVARVDALGDADWTRPVRCEGWHVGDLVHHMAWAAAAQSTALENLNACSAERVARDIPAAGVGTPAEDGPELRRQVTRMRRALAALDTADMERPCPMPFGVMPGAVALHLTAAEAGIHRNDLLWALGDEAPLDADVVVALTVIMSNALPSLAGALGADPGHGIGYRLQGETVDYRLHRSDSTWTAGDDTYEPDCIVSGDDTAVTLFVMGRIPASHRSLVIAGDAGLASRFKAFFPGP